MVFEQRSAVLEARKPEKRPAYLFSSFQCVSPLTNDDKISLPVELLASSQMLPNKYISLEGDFLQLSGKLQWHSQLISPIPLPDSHQIKD